MRVLLPPVLFIALLLGALAEEKWWAFQPLRTPTVPETQGENGIDAFVTQALAERGMTPASAANRETLLRRLYYDLIGLPPTPAETAAFVADSAADAWERRIDALLDDPRHGEHWATMWLDLVRYSESDGWNQDAYRPHIWRYRDYVVRAFNEDKPYPVFVREQLAGDELPGDDPDRLEAAGFLRLGIYEYNQRDARGHWNDIMNELTDTAGDVFLGMSVACARCHDHKFDDIEQKDYFRLRAFFEPVIWRDDLKAATDADHADFASQQSVWEEATKEIRGKIDSLLKPYHDRKWIFTVDKFPLDIQACFRKPEGERTSWEHQMAYLVSRQFLEEAGGPLKNISDKDKAKHEELKAELAAFDHLKPKPLPEVMTVSTFPGTRSPTTIADTTDQAPVPPGFLSALAGASDPKIPPTSQRGALAQWITEPTNPLTTRVIVNRLWQQHFGQGLVATANDFGRKGSLPTHPELLDWLTQRFIDDGWSFKKLHRRILTSKAWQQSAHHSAAADYQKRDPEENLLWRARVRRLPAEAIRDSMLALSGEMNPHVGGPSVDEEVPRRALYVKRFRNDNETFLHAFDMALGLKSVAERTRTTTATQSLTLINGDYALKRARVWAEKLIQSDTPISQALEQAWGRPPTSPEIEHSMRLVGDTPTVESLTDLCHVLFNSSEFLYVH